MPYFGTSHQLGPLRLWFAGPASQPTLFALRSRAYIKYTLPKLKIKLYLHVFELCCQLLTF